MRLRQVLVHLVLISCYIIFDQNQLINIFYNQAQSKPQSPTTSKNYGLPDQQYIKNDSVVNKFESLDLNDDYDDIVVRQDMSENPYKQYVAVQQGHDIPIQGLRKPAPVPSKGKFLKTAAL